MFLPMVAPRRGLTQHDWYSGWQRACVMTGKPKGVGVPNLPIPTQGGWSKIPLKATEGGEWLRNILAAAGIARAALVKIGTHSLKTTCLTWCAKHGEPIEIRRFLGYHSAPGDKVALIYSRDAASAPLRRLDAVISAIRSGRFFPDMTRSGYFVNPAQGLDQASSSASQSAASPVGNSVSDSLEDDVPSDSEDSQDEEDD
ncbi:unnamed protein product, partial [Effrenium voratum]